jgi:hypothetical protein
MKRIASATLVLTTLWLFLAVLQATPVYADVPPDRLLSGPLLFEKWDLVEGVAYPTSVGVGDLGGDGDIDIVALSAFRNEVAVWEQDDAGAFALDSFQALYFGWDHVPLCLLDVDGDGADEIVLSEGDWFVYWERNGAGEWERHSLVGSEMPPVALMTADVDADGDDDLVASLGYMDRLALVWFRNDGGGAFSRQPIAEMEVSYPGEVDLDVADLNGDGRPDIVYLAYSDVVWYEQSEAGEWTAHGLADEPLHAYSLHAVAAGDLDGDGDVDLVGDVPPPGGAAGTYLWINDGAGQFSPQHLPGFGTVYSAVTGDINGDGLTDIGLVTLSGGGELECLMNDGELAFTPHGIAPASRDVPLIAADLDGDGADDLLNVNDDVLEVFWWSWDGAGFVGHNLYEDLVAHDGTFAMADLDSDGDIDLFQGTSDRYAMAWLENDGAVPFETHLIKQTSTDLSPWALADVDGNGYTDVVAEGVWLYRDLALQATDVLTAELFIDVPDGVTITYVQMEDLEGDGDVDWLGVSDLGELYVAWNDAADGPDGATTPLTAVWQPAFFLSVGHDHGEIPTADVDDDGDLDLFALPGGAAFWHENKGQAFALSEPFLSEVEAVVRMTWGDLDGDSDPDALLFVEGEGPELLYWENEGWPEGTLHSLFDQAQPRALRDLHTAVGTFDLADLDNDGDLDLMLGLDRAIGWLRNDGVPAFDGFSLWHRYYTPVAASPEPARSLLDPLGFEVADLDNDGWLDVTLTGSIMRALGMRSLGLYLDPQDVLTVTMEAGPERFYPGWNLYHTFGFTNTTSYTLTNATITNPWPDGTCCPREPRLADAQRFDDEAARHTVWDLGEILPGEAVTVRTELHSLTSLPCDGAVTTAFEVDADQLGAIGVYTTTSVVDCSLVAPTPAPTATPQPTATPPILEQVSLPLIVR